MTASGSFRALSIAELPPRAWLFTLSKDSGGQLLHGSSVDLFQDGFFEGCYDAAATPDLSQASNVFGSGLKIRDSRYHFVTASHTLESLFVYERQDGWTVSNSLAFLVAFHDLQVPWDYGYGRVFSSLSLGIDRYEKRLFTTPAGVVWRSAYDNVVIDPGAGATIVRKPTVAAPRTYADYVGCLRSVLGGALAYASRDRSSPLATCSSGYDSACVTALARDLGCVQALTLRSARGGEADSGLEVGRALGLEVMELDRLSSVDDLSKAASFLAAGTGGEDCCFLPFAPYLRRRVLLTGFQGGALWNLHDPPSGVLARVDVSGCSLQEFRLQTDFSHIPVPVIALLHDREIDAISKSKEMEPYRIGTDYDKPIPRRILDEHGVPRHVYGVSKKAASVLLFREAGTLAPSARRELVSHLRELRPAWGQRLGYSARVALWEMRIFAFRLARSIGQRLPPVNKVAPWIVGEWRAFEHSHPRALALFMTGLELTRQRYRSASAGQIDRLIATPLESDRQLGHGSAYSARSASTGLTDAARRAGM